VCNIAGKKQKGNTVLDNFVIAKYSSSGLLMSNRRCAKAGDDILKAWK
jgi:hypothetical protein